MSGRQPEAERQGRARREPDGHALARGAHVAPALPVHRELRHLPQHAPRAREEDRIEEPEEHDEPGREAPQPEKREDGAEAQPERAPARERRPAEPPLHQVRHRAHPTTSSTAALWTYLTCRASGQGGAKALYSAAIGDLLLRGGLTDGRRRDVAIRDGRIHRLRAQLHPTRDETPGVADKLRLPGLVQRPIPPGKALLAHPPHRLSP